jgi:hypothetical protein
MRAVAAYGLPQGWRDFLLWSEVFLRGKQVPTRRLNEMQPAKWND